MRPLRDSTASRHDGAALRARIAEEGYVYLRGIVDAELLAEVAHEARVTLQQAGWLAPDVPADEAPIRPPARDFKDDNFFDGYAAVLGLESFNRVPHDPALGEVMRALVGPDVFCHPMKVARLIWPVELGRHGGLYAHQDFPVLHIQDMFVTWVPFTDVPRALGGLAVRVGSQNEGVVPAGKVDAGDGAWATTDYEPGDVVIFHCLTVHAALPNRTDRLRLSGDFRWQSASLPLPRFCLQPHHNPRVPAWDALAHGWASDEWARAPDGLVLTDDQPFGEVHDVPASRFVTVPAGTTGAGMAYRRA